MESMKMNKESVLFNIAKGVFISITSTVILLIIFALILTYTNVNENVINPVIIIITAISILLGSSFR